MSLTKHQHSIALEDWGCSLALLVLIGLALGTCGITVRVVSEPCALPASGSPTSGGGRDPR